MGSSHGLTLKTLKMVPTAAMLECGGIPKQAQLITEASKLYCEGFYACNEAAKVNH